MRGKPEVKNILQSISIKNFQAHKNLDLEFGETITSIIGPSDRGKSSVLRALIWNITNRPTGDSFIRYGADSCSVTVKVGNHTVERIRSKKQNSYILDGVEFKALKSDVPPEVIKIFSVTDNNIQQQFDPIFWFSCTAGDVGRQLNEIVNLDIIDYTLTGLQSKQRQAKQSLEIVEQMIGEQEYILKDAEKIEAVTRLIARIGDMQETQVAVESGVTTLEKSISNIQRMSKTIDTLVDWEERQRQLDETCEAYIQTVAQTNRLKEAIQQISVADEQLRFQVPEELFTTIARIEEMNDKQIVRRKEYKRLSVLITEAKDAGEDARNAERKAEEAETALHKILDSNVCPLCGRGENK